jgi:hypothetical protein
MSIRLFRQTTVVYPHRQFLYQKDLGREGVQVNQIFCFNRNFVSGVIELLFLRFAGLRRRRRRK